MAHKLPEVREGGCLDYGEISEVVRDNFRTRQWTRMAEAKEREEGPVDEAHADEVERVGRNRGLVSVGNGSNNAIQDRITGKLKP